MHRGLSESVESIVARARDERRGELSEAEGLALAGSLGIGVPEHVLVRDAEDALERREYLAFPGSRLVVKVVAPGLAHKSDVGGVAVVERSAQAVAQAIRAMAERLGDREIKGYGVHRFVDHEAGPGGELIVGLRVTEDFGPVVVVGPGGLYAEQLAASLRPEVGVAILSPSLAEPERIAAVLAPRSAVRLATARLRGRAPQASLDDLVALVTALLGLAERAAAAGLVEFEINPLALTPQGPVALDVLARLGPPSARPATRPVDKLPLLLEPRSAAVIGVSDRPNPGRVILENMLREGFPADRLHVVKPGRTEVLGCPAWPDIEALPERVDLFILAIDAGQIPGAVERIVRSRKAETLIVIPGGLGESEGSDEIVAGLERSLAAARASDWRGPLINGGNCLGIRSRPGRYDTLFLPEAQVPRPRGAGGNLALISQSGAFAVSRLTKLAGLDPRYLVSFGNQFDLTAGDYLAHLARDPAIDLVACYVEGFRPLDGRAWLEAADSLHASGKTVILYRGGRTPAGQLATASHTASIAGDYAVTRELARAAGVVLADSLEEFEDLTLTFALLGDRRPRGRGLGAVSNAGFECVAVADAVGELQLAELDAATRERIRAILARRRLERIVGARNPLDVTPILDDEGFTDAVRAVLDDPRVDVGVVGCVPMTPALTTLPGAAGSGAAAFGPGSVVERLACLHADSAKPFVAVVDGGPLYDPMVRALEAHGVPTFRTADRALRALESWCRRWLEPRVSARPEI